MARCYDSCIVALRNEKGSYNYQTRWYDKKAIVALRNEKGSYNAIPDIAPLSFIVALRNEKGAIQIKKHHLNR